MPVRGICAVLMAAGLCVAAVPFLSLAGQRWAAVILVCVVWLAAREMETPLAGLLDAVFVVVVSFALLLAILETAGLIGP